MIDVVCAVIFFENRILIAQRSEHMNLPLKWEFPGGKIKPGEDKEVALKREIKEELAMTISVGKSLKPVVHHYKNFSIRLFPFLCEASSPAFKKTEHKEIRWETKENLKNYDWAEADVPVVGEVVELFEKIRK